MKKIVSFALVLVLSLSFCACGNKKTQTSSTISEFQNATEPTETQPQWFTSDSSEHEDIAIKITGIKPTTNEKWHGYAALRGSSPYDSMFVIYKSGDPDASFEDFMSEAVIGPDGALGSYTEDTELKISAYEYSDNLPAIYVDKYSYSFIVLKESNHSNIIFQLLMSGIDVTCSYYISNVLYEVTLTSEGFDTTSNAYWYLDTNSIKPCIPMLEETVTLSYINDIFNNAYSEFYLYNSKMQISKMTKLPSYDIHKYTYDDNGNLAYSEYEYDWCSDEGCIATVKKTYNSHGDEETRTTTYRSPENRRFDDGEVEKYKYEYEYNEDGTIKTETKYINGEKSSKYEYVHYYDDNGRVIESKMKGKSFQHKMQYSHIVRYMYDEDGNLIFKSSVFSNMPYDPELDLYLTSNVQQGYYFYSYIK